MGETVVLEEDKLKALGLGCTYHFVPRASAPKQAELGDLMTLEKGRGAWEQAGMR